MSAVSPRFQRIMWRLLAQLRIANTASHEELQRLGLNDEMTGKILDNRPYRNKLDLLARMVIPEATYNGIRSMVGVAGATQSVKIAG